MSLAIYLAGLALIAAVAWAASSPLFAMPTEEAGDTESPAHERWRKRKEEALASLRDAEFDFQLGKLSETDYRELRARLEAEAVQAMAGLERMDDGNAR